MARPYLRHHKKLLLLFGLPLVAFLFIAGGVYAAINLNAPSSPDHTKTNSAINIDSAEAGLVGEWKLNGNAKDSTPYSDNGTITGGVTSTIDRNGQTNSAMNFDGSSGYIDVGTHSALQPTQTTWSAWIDPTNVSADQMFMSEQYANYFRINSSRLFLSFYVAGVQKTLIGNTVLNNNEWYFVTATYNGSAMTLYLNGQQDAQLTGLSGNLISTTGEFDLGRWEASSPRYFTGSMSDARVYSRALSASDVANLYNYGTSQIQIGGSGLAGSISLGKGLVGYWPFTGNAKDATPYSDNWTLSGQTYGTNRFGTANASIAFPAGSVTTMTGGTNAALSSANAISVNIWLKLNSFGTYYAVHPVGKWQDGVTTNANYALYVFGDYEGNNDQGQVRFYAIRGGTWNGVSATTYRISTGTWYMITLTYTAASGGQLYINGQAVGGLTGSGALATNTYPLVSDFQDGNIADLSIYNRALSAAEVLALYGED